MQNLHKENQQNLLYNYFLIANIAQGNLSLNDILHCTVISNLALLMFGSCVLELLESFQKIVNYSKLFSKYIINFQLWFLWPLVWISLWRKSHLLSWLCRWRQVVATFKEFTFCLSRVDCIKCDSLLLKISYLYLRIIFFIRSQSSHV